MKRNDMKGDWFGVVKIAILAAILLCIVLYVSL